MARPADPRMTPRALADAIEVLADPAIRHDKRVEAALAAFHAGALDAKLGELVPLAHTLIARIDKCRT